MALIPCKTCEHEIAKSAKACPNCGAAAVSTASSVTTLIYFALVAVLAFWVWGLLSSDAEAQGAHKWYEGGTLAQASGLEWQAADAANKLATSVNLIAVLWQKKRLKPEIMETLQDIEDFRPWAALLVSELDAAFEPDPDPEQNKKMFANQDVATMAVMVMAMGGWIAQ